MAGKAHISEKFRDNLKETRLHMRPEQYQEIDEYANMRTFI